MGKPKSGCERHPSRQTLRAEVLPRGWQVAVTAVILCFFYLPPPPSSPHNPRTEDPRILGAWQRDRGVGGS